MSGLIRGDILREREREHHLLGSIGHCLGKHLSTMASADLAGQFKASCETYQTIQNLITTFADLNGGSWVAKFLAAGKRFMKLFEKMGVTQAIQLVKSLSNRDCLDLFVKEVSLPSFLVGIKDVVAAHSTLASIVSIPIPDKSSDHEEVIKHIKDMVLVQSLTADHVAEIYPSLFTQMNEYQDAVGTNCQMVISDANNKLKRMMVTLQKYRCGGEKLFSKLQMYMICSWRFLFVACRFTPEQVSFFDQNCANRNV